MAPHLNVSPEVVGLSSAMLREAFERFRTITSPAGQRLPGGIMSVARHGKLCFVETFGHVDETGVRPTSVDDIYSIASMTKIITSVAAMLLVQDGKLDVEDEVSKHLPQLSRGNFHVANATSTEPDTKASSPANTPVQIKHLMTHTAGFSYNFYRRPTKDNVAQADAHSAVVNGTVDEFVDKMLAFEPGTHFRYSCGPVLLGLVVEAISGMSLEEFMRVRIFDPLHMTDTSYQISEENKQRFVPPLLATAKHVALADGDHMNAVLGEFDTGTPLRGCMSVLGGDVGEGRNACKGDGGLLTTIHDWHAFATMLVNRGVAADGTRLLEEHVYAEMVRAHTPDMDSKGAYAGFNTHLSDTPGSGGNLLGSGISSGGFAHSLCAMVAVSDKNHIGASVGSFGWEGVFCTKFWVDPRQGLSVTYLSNVMPCWRWDIHRQVTPLVYASLSDKVHA